MNIKKKTLIWITLIWVIITFINYYYTNFFFLAFIWFGMVLFFAIITLIELSKLNTTRASIIKFIVLLILLFFTFRRDVPNLIIEKIDWVIFENKRNEIVKQVKKGILNPNVEWNGWVCELPYEFPVVSNGGNDIGIYRNKKQDKLTVSFWVFRNFFDHPSTYIIYSNDKKIIDRLEKKIDEKPKNNWKLKKNWYRIYGDY